MKIFILLLLIAVGLQAQWTLEWDRYETTLSHYNLYVYAGDRTPFYQDMEIDTTHRLFRRSIPFRRNLTSVSFNTRNEKVKLISVILQAVDSTGATSLGGYAIKRFPRSGKMVLGKSGNFITKKNSGKTY